MAKVVTNIRLEAEQLKQLKRIALENGESLARLFERIFSQYLSNASVLSGRDWRNDSFFQLGKDARKSRVARVSEQHDRHIYGIRLGRSRGTR